MVKMYEKWRDLEIDPMNINYKNIKINKIISYPPAGNDVVECECYIDKKLRNTIIKIERSKVSDFLTESINLKKLKNDYKMKVADVIEIDKINNKYYIVLEKLDGERLSDIFNDGVSQEQKEKYLINYGYELALIHNIPVNNFNEAKQRIINNYPKLENYDTFDNFIKPYIDFLKNNIPKFNDNTFIHGDFHYANILWKNEKINGILDFEYSGRGFKEQDIAWACILRPTQSFMDNIEDIKAFLKGYLNKGKYDKNDLKWCFINGYCHFYLMNLNNKEYIKKLKKILNEIINFDFDI